jgi:hypothetical protein
LIKECGCNAWDGIDIDVIPTVAKLYGRRARCEGGSLEPGAAP